LYYANNHKTDTRNCLATLNSELRRRDIHSIPNKDKNNPNSIRTYETILRNWRRKHEIINSAQHNVSFKKFVDSIKVIEGIGQ